MSLEDAEIFVMHIHRRLGRFPILYTNGVTAQYIADNSDRYRLLSRLPLWYARYKPEIGLHFPKGNWKSYTLWQFSAGANCDAKACPYRVPGTSNDIDVNVASMSADELRAAWPFGGLIDKTVDMIATVPLPISREEALLGDVVLQYAEVEEPVRPAAFLSMFPDAGQAGPMRISLGKQAAHARSGRVRVLCRDDPGCAPAGACDDERGRAGDRGRPAAGDRRGAVAVGEGSAPGLPDPEN